MLNCLVYLAFFAVAHAALPDICPKIVSKKSWGGRTAVEVDYALIPIEYVVVHHTVTGGCDSERSCSDLLVNIQDFHMDKLDFHDIGYNFLVAPDGKIYEGAGWHKVGAHTRGYNSRSLGLGFIGTFTKKLPNHKQLTAAKNFLKCSVELGELDENYKLLAARQVSSTESPGRRLYEELQKWSHFTKDP